MELIQTIEVLQERLSAVRKEGKKVGLVPTMGALHQGHASLVERSVAENDVTVVSVFLNPTQFNDKTDLEKYPRTLEADCALLDKLGTTFVFAPSVDEMYPEPDTRKFSYAPIDTVMEGAFRPGHFNGVGQVVRKDLKFKVEIVPCPVVREESGLAMSSRNTLLTDEERKIAANISKILFKSKNFAANHTLEETKKYVVDSINAIVGLEVQYYEIADGITLQTLKKWSDSDYIVGCITVFCGSQPIRLIDHIKYKG